MAPPIVAASRTALEIVQRDNTLRERLRANTEFFREQLEATGFEILPGTHPIVPIMIHDAQKAAEFAEHLLQRSVYVVAFSFPVVPQGKARIRTQVSAAHTRDDLEFAVRAFAQVKSELGM